MFTRIVHGFFKPVLDDPGSILARAGIFPSGAARRLLSTDIVVHFLELKWAEREEHPCSAESYLDSSVTGYRVVLGHRSNCTLHFITESNKTTVRNVIFCVHSLLH
jgi:hypothetical protein